jgi:hypothetical protein
VNTLTTNTEPHKTIWDVISLPQQKAAELLSPGNQEIVKTTPAVFFGITNTTYSDFLHLLTTEPGLPISTLFPDGSDVNCFGELVLSEQPKAREVFSTPIPTPADAFAAPSLVEQYTQALVEQYTQAFRVPDDWTNYVIKNDDLQNSEMQTLIARAADLYHDVFKPADDQVIKLAKYSLIKVIRKNCFWLDEYPNNFLNLANALRFFLAFEEDRGIPELHTKAKIAVWFLQIENKLRQQLSLKA